MLETICESLSCALVHHLGKTLIIYRPDVAAQKAKAEAENATRAIRKPSEPHTPKKLAAEGVTRTRRSEKTKRTEQKTEKLETIAPRARRASAANAERPAPGIPSPESRAFTLDRKSTRKNT